VLGNVDYDGSGNYDKDGRRNNSIRNIKETLRDVLNEFYYSKKGKKENTQKSYREYITIISNCSSISE
jgi:hypothetical protein